MSEEDLGPLEEAFSHISEATIDYASRLRFDSQDAGLDLGLLMQSRAKGDCAWFLLTRDDEQPLSVLCAILCTPHCVLIEFISPAGSFDQSIMGDDATDYFAYLGSIGWRKLSDSELEILQG
jgi:hypothetical protein